MDDVAEETIDVVALKLVHTADWHLGMTFPAFGVDARLIAEDDEVDTLGGLTFLLAGRILSPGESVEHPSGWRLEAADSDARKILRVRLHAPATDKPAA